MVPGATFPQDGRLAHGRRGAHDTGRGRETRPIYEEDRLLLRLGPYLIAGHVSSRHCAIATSSRCCARRTGFWGLQARSYRDSASASARSSLAPSPCHALPCIHASVFGSTEASLSSISR